MSWVVVSLHDVASQTGSQCRTWMRVFDRAGIPVSMLVIPGPWRGEPCLDAGDADAVNTVEWLHECVAAGHEIVQHGWTHSEDRRFATIGARTAVGRLMARGCAEFWHLDRAEASRRVIAGQRVFGRVGLTVHGFVAPGWLLSPGSTKALCDHELRYTTTHLGVVDLDDGRRSTAPALSQRPSSPLAGHGAALTGAVAKRLIAARRPLRIAVHPDDLDDRRCRSAVLALCAATRDAQYQFLTYASLVGLADAHDADAR